MNRWISSLATVAATVLASAAFGEQGADDHSRLSGAWVLNKDLSDGSAPAFTAPPEGGAPGGRGGGMGPGGTGPRGPGSGGAPGGAPNPEEMKKMQALMEELLAAPARLTITVEDAAVTFVLPDGRTQRYATSGKKEKHQLDSASVETVTKWERSALLRETTGGGLNVRETYTVSARSRQLEVTVKVEDRRMPRPLSLKRVYDDVLAR